MAAFRYPFRVKFDNVDYARVLYFPRQIDLFIEALEEFSRKKLGVSFRRMLDEEKLSWPTVHIEADYLAPLEYEDQAEVHVFVRRISDKSITFGYEVHRLPDGAITCRGRHVVAMLDLRTGLSLPVPEAYRRLLAPFVEAAENAG